MEVKEKMKKLIEEINKHNYQYYVLDKPIISDYEYDKLYYELVDLEKQIGLTLPNSPTLRVGGDILPGFKKFNHEISLYSLNKVQNYSELIKWVDNIKKDFPNADFSVEYKYDGLSIVVEYENGILKRAGTRGNGRVGEDVTAQVRTIKSVPLEIPFKDKIIIQGEGMITLSNLEKYNKIAKEPLKNARNAVAGAIRNLDPKETAKRNLDLFVYLVNYIENKKFNTQKEINDFLIQNNFKTAGFFKVYDTADNIINEIKKIDEIKSSLDILMDGVVIKVNQLNYREEIGYTTKFPKWAVAYKYDPEELSTKLRDIVWQVGRTGKLTPIALIEPVNLAGATISRATLNNMGDIKRKKVKLGARVFVRRSNEVIPEILGLAEDDENSKEISPPDRCPSCGGIITENGANLFCTNIDCPEQIVDSITHFTSKEAMNIEGLSDKTIQLLYDKLNLRKVSDIYELKYDDLIKLEGFKEKKVQNLLESIENSKKVGLSSFIFALGIKEVGIKTARDLVRNFKSFERIKNADLQELVNVRDIGDIVGKSIYDYFRNEKNLNEINNLFNKGIEIKKENINTENEFYGKIIVLTGGLKNYSRIEATKILEKLGAIVSQSVGKSTDLVLAGEEAGSKLDKAKKFGIKIITENDFEKAIQNKI